MKKDAIISLPLYKILYAAAFVALAAIVRGVFSVEEIGIALDYIMALLAGVFCADTVSQELQEGRWEILCLIPANNRKKAIRRRVFVQLLFLMLLTCVGYGLFLIFQSPLSHGGEISLFFQTVFATTVSMFFFAELTVFLVHCTGNLWAGIGIMAAFWFLLGSKAGQQIPFTLQVFSFVNRDLQSPQDVSWLIGKGVALFAAIIGFVFQGGIGHRRKGAM